MTSSPGTVAGGLAMAASSGALGDAAEALAPEAISLIVVMTVNAAISAIKASRGEISWDEAGYRMAKSSIVVAGGTAGAVIGTALLPGIGTVIGSIVGAAVTRTVTVGTEHVAMSLAVSHGWSFFGIVDQDYRVPEPTLRCLGWDTVQLDGNLMDNVELDQVQLDTNDFDSNLLDAPVRFIRRGVIGVRRVGYV